MNTKCVVLFTILLLPLHVEAAVKVVSVFSDHMVLQRDATVAIWGEADPNQTITVKFADQVASARANQDGNWRIELSPLDASTEARTLTIEADGENRSTVYKDVLVGDVWVGSGQSNMAGRVASYAKKDETLAALVKQAPFPNIRLMLSGPNLSWSAATPQAVASFSAIHFAFGQRLQHELDVPIGLIVGAVGGTPSGSWIPSTTYADSEKCKAAVAQFAKTYDRKAVMRQYEAKLAVWKKQAAAARAKDEKPRGRRPSTPYQPGESSRGKIGGLYERFIEPVVGYRIRGVLWDQGEGRTGVVGVDQHTMMSELFRGWREAWGQGDFPFVFVQKPSGGGFAFSNDNPITRNGDPFVAQLPDIAKLGSGDQRFLYVRLMHDNSNTWMVPASDLGSGIHPTNKWGYGNRAAEVALSQVYRTGVQAYGPTYRSHKLDGSKVVIRFEHVGKGLMAAGNSKLQGFALTGDDGQWHWAEGTIDGDTVVAWSENVPQPTRIRYAYAPKRQWANLFNKDGLPALAFEAGK
ncbi:MAG: sialate O-acetylesterase [Fuerstiella sp.]